MAVIVRYVVVRDGKEDMNFTSKKEADAYDKMLDIAEGLYDFLRAAELDLSDDQLDALTFFMARERDQVSSLLKGVKPGRPAARASQPKAAAKIAREPAKPEKDERGTGVDVPAEPVNGKGSRAAKPKEAA